MVGFVLASVAGVGIFVLEADFGFGLAASELSDSVAPFEKVASELAFGAVAASVSVLVAFGAASAAVDVASESASGVASASEVEFGSELET